VMASKNFLPSSTQLSHIVSWCGFFTSHIVSVELMPAAARMPTAG
jgi:hypothetical protein